MSKRDLFGDPSDNDEGPSSKMRKIDDSDDGGSGGGRTGRVRKKSAKVLEMEEFEQAEKSTSGVKKSKTPKTLTLPVADPSMISKKTTAVAPSIEATPTSRKNKKNVEVTSPTEGARSIPAELSLRVPTMMSTPMETQPPIHNVLQESSPGSPDMTFGTTPLTIHKQEGKQENPKSVIKYLLSSPVAGSGQQLSTGAVDINSPLTVTEATPPPPKKLSKKIKFDDSKKSGSSTKPKKMKIEIMSPSEIGPPMSSRTPTEPKGTGLKMKIMSGSNPMSAQVSLEPGDSLTSKIKKAPKKMKTPKTSSSDNVKSAIEIPDEDKSTKKKKVSKKKEKLIQDAISAAKQMPNLASLVSSPNNQSIVSEESPSPVQKLTKKKIKNTSKKDTTISDSLVMDFDDAEMMDEVEESTLVIAETEKKKKKTVAKKKSPTKEKEGAGSFKAEKVKKIPKRAPTAYMLFCNTHRPDIVAENPGIEFASISRKLGELWQTQSSKQKLQWRRKAQRRLKKSNLISTGKMGKESQGGPSVSAAVSAPSQGGSTVNSASQKLALMFQKSKPVAMDEGPLSPAKVGIDPWMQHDSDSSNFSIEPLDVAAHLKLLGESLSIIGMRLQEHKGMIAVQGSLSVLLDSLLCACGPLLCLTQQVPGMDGCSPLVHAQTLDSVAYVMPGL